MATGHYLTVPTGNATPKCWVGVVVESQVAEGLPEGCTALPAKFCRVTATWTRQARGKWSDPVTKSWDDPAGFWSWLEGYGARQVRTWVVCPVATDALTLLLFWERCDRLGARFRRQLQVRGAPEQMSRVNPAFVFSRLVMRGKPDIVEYTLHQRSYTWLSFGQYWPSELSRQNSQGQRQSSSSASEKGTNSRSTLTPTERSEAITRTMRSLGDWWSGLSAGAFGRTIGSMAYSFLRSRMMPRYFSTHTDIRAQKLERIACHGGRASTWFFGDVVSKDHTQSEHLPPLPRECPWHLAGTLYHVDVSSMYVWLLTQVDTPYKHVTTDYNETPKGLAGLLKWHECVAQVMLDTPVAEYPHRYKDRVIYPTGRFRAVLCGAELRRALADGVVTQVFVVAIYDRGRPFQRAGEELLAMRAAARDEKDEGWETFCKLLGNSVTGKLAQRSSVWADRPKKWAEKDWGEWPEPCPLTGVVTRYRSTAGMVQEMVKDTPSVGTRTACYAHITSAGRHLMRTIRERLPSRSVVSQDTDGLWVTREAWLALGAPRRADPPVPGRLRLVEESTASRWYSPKHYYAAGHWTLAGMCHPVPRSSALSFFDEWTSNLCQTSSPRPPNSIHLHTREVTLALTLADGSVGADGWQVPHCFQGRLKSGLPVDDAIVTGTPPSLFDVG